jgi:hypothetical protein
MTSKILRIGQVAILAMMACGDDGGGAGADVDAGPGDTVDADLSMVADAAPILTGLDAFCTPGGAYELLIGTRSSCQLAAVRSLLNRDSLAQGAALQQSCHELLGPLIADPTVSFDDTKITGCVAYLTATSCIELPADLGSTPCADLFIGTVATDGECDDNNQCAGDAYCQRTQQGCNLCADRLALGAACLADRQCSDGTCNSLDQCAAPIALGGGCLGDADCAGSMVCSVGGTCESPNPKQGDPCDGHLDCTRNNASFAFGLYCDPSTDGGVTPGSCEPLPALGESCGPNGPGGQPLCDFIDYLWCDTTNNTCAAPTTSAVGGACNAFAVVGFGARQCEANVACSNPTGQGAEPGICVVPGYEGDACTMANGQNNCYPGYACANSLCEAPALLSGNCPAP